MHYSLIAILAIINACTSQAGILEVIDYEHQCLMWSNDNYGCTGYSASFGLLDGDDCSKLSEVVNGARRESFVLSVDVCGTEDGSPAASIQVNQTGLVTFSNKDGNKSTCVLNNGLKAGSWCIASELGTTNSPSHSSTSIPYTSIPSTSTPYTTTLSATTLSTTTPSTTTLSAATKDNLLTMTSVYVVTTTVS